MVCAIVLPGILNELKTRQSRRFEAGVVCVFRPVQGYGNQAKVTDGLRPLPKKLCRLKIAFRLDPSSLPSPLSTLKYTSKVS